MNIQFREIAPSPNKYEAYLYRFENATNNKIYVGYHLGAVNDTYQHSSTNDEFNEEFQSTDAKFYFENMNLDHTISGYTHIMKQDPIMYPPIRQGDMIVFPSFIRHGVHLQKNDTKRTTLSFNLDVR